MSRLFGPIRQNGYVIRDMDRALDYWTRALGVGPFFYIKSLRVVNYQYLGRASDPDIDVAVAQCGPLQIELIAQNNDAPSMFRDFLDRGFEGLQHIAFWTEQFDVDMARYGAAGFEIAQSGQSGSGAADERFAYFTAESHPGTVIEISEIGGAKGRFYREVADAARDWNGTDPIRYV